MFHFKQRRGATRVSPVTRGRVLAGGLALALVVSAAAGSRPAAAQGSDHAGAVYAMTNQPTGNAIAVFQRAPDGTLTPAGDVPTGGMGSGTFDGSQGGLVLSRNDQLLFAVNAGSNEISVFDVATGGPVLVAKVASGGLKPVSLTVSPDSHLLYVLNQISGTVSGFAVSAQGQLTPLAGSTRALVGGPTSLAAEVSFDPKGKVLVVTEKGPANTIDTFVVGADGLLSAPQANTNTGVQPFGFAFTKHGAASQLIVTESYFGIQAAGAASSFAIGSDGALQPISASVANTQSDTCWFVVTDNQQYGYVSNFGDGTLSSYTIAADGTLTLLNPIAATSGLGPQGRPVDEALSKGSRYLYERSFTYGTVDAFAVEADGSLTLVQRVPGLPPGAVGLAAR